MTITYYQIRAARGLVGLEATELARLAGLTPSVVYDFEKGETKPHATTINQLVGVLENKGVEFLGEAGVQLREDRVRMFVGADRFDDFYDFMWEHLKARGGEVCLSITDENLLRKYRKKPEVHRERMKALYEAGRITMRTLQTSGITKSAYAKVRLQPPQSTVGPTSFYAFGDCLALMTFDEVRGPNVLVVQSPALAEAYRSSFDAAWDRADVPGPSD